VATAETKRVRGKWFVIPFVAVIAVTTAAFLTIQLSGRGAKARNYLALSYTAGLRDIDEGFYADAVKSLTPVVESGTEPAAYGFRGEAYLRLEKYAEAEADFRKALEREPSLPANHAGLADALASQGKLEEALPHLDAAIELHRRGAPPPGRVRRWGDVLTDVLTRRMRLLQALGRHDEAARDAAELKSILKDRAAGNADR
jgi:tetratricopeptide (TPR) repeat protein